MTIYIQREHDHQFDHIAALSESIAEELAEEYGIRWGWKDEKLEIRHSSARGFMLAEEGMITIELRLGFAASLFSSSIEASILERLDQLLN
ncbi:polyhydroxyalkanoic acid system family protein [Photobacterium jeanii]|uniref:polyhydroxyalkanoic acid system family protein n=1 Tax=Photobacterium jeanii TaxID=858640 RepID=UPI000A971429|nr:polyhydroxyalkanoic acid system family protein [Photobacterium jeanii]